MKSISQDIRDHLNEHQDVYMNDHGVETELRMSGYICVVAQWPGATHDDDFVVEVYIEEESIDSLLALAGIYTFQQFLDLTPTHLCDLYHDGKAVVACYIDRGELQFEMDFLKYENSIWAVNDSEDACIIPIAPETADDFLLYLKRHAKLNSLNF